MATLCLDISTSAITDAAAFIDDPKPPANYKKPEAIAEWVAAEKVERLARASLDLDLCCITGIALTNMPEMVTLCRTEADERAALAIVADLARAGAKFVTYNGRAFDIPVLKRRARYLGVSFPHISTDRFKSPVEDLMAVLSENDPTKRRSLNFYCKRLGWADLCEKPLSGAEEARVPQTGDWAGLEASLRRDVEAIRRLADWLGLL